MTPKKIPLSKLRYHWPIYFFVLPSLFLIVMFQYYPASSGVYHSFFRWNGADIKEFIGFENYLTLIRKSDFWASFRIALLIGLFNVLKMIPAIGVAICIHRARSERMQWLYRVAFVAPMVIPGLIVVLIWRSFFFEATSGYLNLFLNSTGLMNVLIWLDSNLLGLGIFAHGHQPAWLGDGRLLLFSAIVWGFPWVGSFAVLMYLAKLQSIPQELYEAGDLDGTTWWSKCTKIELPLIMGSIGLNLVFVIIGTLKDAGTILALAGVEGGPGGVVTVPSLYAFREAFVNQQFGAACAVGIVLTIVVIGLKTVFDYVADWENLTPGQRLAIRLIGLAFAWLVLRIIGSPLIAIVVVLACIPWNGIINTVRTATARLFPSRPYVYHAPPMREQNRLGSMTLRASKHGWILLVLGFAYLPMYLMLVVSLKDNNQFYEFPATPTAPFQWHNWVDAWNAVIPSLANSIFITTSSTIFTLIIALSAAYFFARVEVPGSKFMFTALFVLLALPEIANLLPLFNLLVSLDLVNTLTALVMVGTAAGQVFAILWLRNFIADIPQDLFEAAEIDGASHLRQLFTVVLPLSAPILGVIGVMHALNQWNDFLLPLIIMRDETRLPVMVQLLRMSGEYIKFWGPMMAGYALASIPVIVLFIACMRLFTKGLTAGAVKG
jgi:ABC-type glycerol-3-phosphate transport system permease component